jgi:hypothetical protein
MVIHAPGAPLTFTRRMCLYRPGARCSVSPGRSVGSTAAKLPASAVRSAALARHDTSTRAAAIRGCMGARRVYATAARPTRTIRRVYLSAAMHRPVVAFARLRRSAALRHAAPR